MSKSKTKGAGAAPLSYDAAMEAFVTATRLRQEGIRRHSEERNTLRDFRARLSAAVKREDYALAAQLKLEREALEASSSFAELGKLRQAVEAAAEALTATYFKEHPEHVAPGVVTVTRVTVVNPETGNSGDVVYTESSDTVNLSLDGRSFDSEGYHLKSWALDAGFLVHVNSVEVKV